MMDLGPGMSYVFTEEWHASIGANSRKRERLRVEASERAIWRGHDLYWYNMDLNRAHGQCRNCEAWVTVNTEPLPNGINIGGPAVAIDCGDQT